MFAADADTAKVLYLIAAVLAAAATVFSVFRSSVETALGWGALAFGLFATWVLL